MYPFTHHPPSPSISILHNHPIRILHKNFLSSHHKTISHEKMPPKKESASPQQQPLVSSNAATTPQLPPPIANEDKQGRKLKQFTHEEVEKYKEYLRENAASDSPIPVTNTFKIYGDANGFTKNQVRNAYYNRILKEDDSKEQHDKKLKQAHDRLMNEIKRKREEESENETDGSEISNNSGGGDDDSFVVDEGNHHAIVSSLMKPPHKMMKMANIEMMYEWMKPFHFETKSNRFYVFRYPAHLEYTRCEIKGNEKVFEIRVKVQSIITSNDVSRMLYNFADMDGLKESHNSNGRPKQDEFTIKEALPKDCDAKSITHGENVSPAGERVYIVAFEKKVVSSFSVPKTTSWDRKASVTLGSLFINQLANIACSENNETSYEKTE